MEKSFGLGILYGIGLYQALMLSGVLVFKPQQNRLANRLLAGLILVISGRIAMALIQQSPLGEDWVIRVMPLALPTTLLYGPLLNLYLTSFIRRDYSLGRRDLLHFVPATVAFLFIMAVAVFIKDRPVPSVPRDTYDKLPLHVVIMGICIAIHVVTYLYVALRRVWRFYRYVKANASNSNIQYFRWMLLMTSLMVLPIFTVMFTIFLADVLPLQTMYPATASSIMISALVILALINSDPLSGIPPTLQVETEEALMPEKYSSSSLADPQKDQILRQLMQYMEAQKPYLDPALTLRALADRLTLNPKYLSQVINERRDQNFLDFINSYRIGRAKELLHHPAYQHYTVLAIAQEVGFNSKSTFYTAFKKFTGKTPTQYKQAEEKEAVS